MSFEAERPKHAHAPGRRCEDNIFHANGIYKQIGQVARPVLYQDQIQTHVRNTTLTLTRYQGLPHYDRDAQMSTKQLSCRAWVFE